MLSFTKEPKNDRVFYNTSVATGFEKFQRCSSCYNETPSPLFPKSLKGSSCYTETPSPLFPKSLKSIVPDITKLVLLFRKVS